jgi:type VI secretion system protein ImpI
MPLMLKLVNETTLPDGGPVSCEISGKRGVDIGRAAHLDWTLPDPTRYISSKHCEIRYKDGGYWLHDVSTNGTFLNGADHRMHAPHRLRNGDRFSIGHYIVAVLVDGAEKVTDGVSSEIVPPDQQNASDQELWADGGEVAPPIDAKLLRPSRQSAPIHPDFLDWSADIPDPFHQSAAKPLPSPPLAGSMEGPVPSDIDWADSASLEAPTPSHPPRTPAPQMPSYDRNSDDTWNEASFVNPDNEPVAERSATDSPSGRALSTVEGDSFVGHVAKAAGIPEELLQGREPVELAQQIGTVLRLVAENLMQLLSARQEAKRLARSSSHTVIQAIDNNPLKFCPSAEDALRIMFGPMTTGYLDAQRAMSQGFGDLKSHQIKTYAAMQHALAMIVGDLDPRKIEAEGERPSVIGGLIQPRNAKLWDNYKVRWESKVGQKGHEAVAAFMRYFAEYYDRNTG